MTRILVYAPIPLGQVGDRLGAAEYSYSFVLKAFLPVLETLGTVIEVVDPAREVDALFDEAVDAGEDCVFLCFAPPHRAPMGLRCPTSTVFAWEFDTIPDEEWGDEARNDWRGVLADHGRAVVLSEHSADAVRRSMGPDFPVTAIPTPTFDRFSRPAAVPRSPVLGHRTIELLGTVLDSREFEFGEKGIHSATLAERAATTPWDGRSVTLTFTDQDAATGCLVGFYAPEPWGSWSRVEEPWLLLPHAVSGPVQIILTCYGLGANAGREITARLGDEEVRFRLPETRSRVVLRFDPERPVGVIEFAGLDCSLVPGLRDERTMGLGLAAMTMRRPSLVPPRAARVLQRLRGSADGFTPVPQQEKLELSGVVFTSVLNPVDTRKNWEELVYGFCHALRDEEEATLLLKMTHRTIASFFANFQYFLHRVGPTRCRILAVHGFLDSAEFDSLIDATTFYANASSAEGLCMPLMEFLSAGVPALAPTNTAMADYVNESNAVIVGSHPMLWSWPHDERLLMRTHSNAIDWGSLRDAFRTAFDIATSDGARYRRMSSAAEATLQDFSSDDVVRQRLAELLAQMTAVRA